MKEILEKSITTENSRTKRVAILMPQVFSVMETRGMGNLKKKQSNMILIALPFSFKLWQHYEMPSKTFFHSHCILNRSVQLKFHLYYIQKHECGLLQQQHKLSQEEEIELDFNFLVA